MKPLTTLRTALNDPALLGLTGSSWSTWRTLLIASRGEPLTEEERTVFSKLTGRAHEPDKPAETVVFTIGRKGGKSKAMATLACYLAACCDYSDVLVRGETGIVLAIAQDQQIAKVVLDFCEGTLSGSALLRPMIANRTQDTITLTNGIQIQVRASSFRRLRGPTYIAALCDEIAFWYVDEYSANPDSEIVNAIKPALGLTGGPLIIASSPYSRKGVLWSLFRRHYGPDGDPAVLVVRGKTTDFNPRYPQAKIDAALQEDYARNAAEYLGEFRSDLEGYITLDVVEARVPHGLFERQRQPDMRYYGYVDPAGGGGSNSFSLGISHREADQVFLDVLLERKPPFSPEQVIGEYAAVLRSYAVHRVVGDCYAGEFPREIFRRCGVTYEPSKKTKSDLYRELLPALNSPGKVTLLDNAKLIAQLTGLERRVARSGKDSIDHAPGLHDDLANACAGALLLALESKRQGIVSATLQPDYADPNGRRLPQVFFDHTGKTTKLIDVQTGQVLFDCEEDRRNPLRGPHGCIPGRGLNSPWVEAMAFNAKHGIKRRP